MRAARPIRRIDRNISASPALEALLREAGAHGIVPPLEQVETAQILIERGEHQRAKRVLLCRPLHDDAVYWQMPCRARECGQCAERTAWRLATRMRETAATYLCPAAVLITCPSLSLLDLPATLGRFRESLVQIRRRRWWQRGCVAGVIAIESPLTRDGRRWSLHAHGIVDLRVVGEERDAWIARARGEWAELAGVFEVEPLRSLAALSSYSVKLGRAKSWAPSLGDLPAHLRVHLSAALKFRRLVTAWGVKK